MFASPLRLWTNEQFLPVDNGCRCPIHLFALILFLPKAMAINPDIRDQAYRFFIEEAPDLLHLIETGLLTLSQDRSTTKIHSLMRSAHSLKGGASGVGLDAIATLAHRLENIFKALYNETVVTDSRLERWLLQAYDCLRSPLMQQIKTGYFDAMQTLMAAEPIFAQIEAYCGDVLTQSESYIPSSAEMGVDMVRSIFEVDVTQGLEQISAALTQSEADLLSELQMQAEIFAGFAEVLNLPNFGAIAQTVQIALTLHPEQTATIAQLALQEFEQSRQAVLAGDRLGGAIPSAALKNFTAAAIDRDTLETLMSAQTEMAIAPSLEAESNSFQPESGDIFEPIVGLEDDSRIELEPSWQLTEYSFDNDDRLEVDIAASLSPIDLIDSVIIDELNQFEVVDRTEFNSENGVFEFENAQDKIVENHLTSEEIDNSSTEDTIVNLGEDNLLLLQSDLINESVDAVEQVEQSEIVELPAQNSFDWIAAKPTEHFQSPINQAAKSEPIIRSNFESSFVPVQSVNPTVATGLTVRVDSERLERMNNLVGELSISRSSLSLQNDQLKRVIRTLRDRFSRFQTMVTRLQNLSDQINTLDQIYGGSDQEPIAHPSEQRSQTLQDRLSRFNISPTYPASLEFDALEMDRYGATHSQIQSILEDLVQLEESVEDIALFTRQSNQTLEQQQYKLTQLRDELVWARMLPLSEVLNRFPRILRDLSMTYEKPVQLQLTGAEILIDRAILEKLYDPLLHLLRNAFDHGIESPSLRQQNGKPEQGQIEIRAFHQGNQTVIEVRDDGRGLDLESIRQHVQELGWLSAEQVETLSATELVNLIFEPGFSTAAQVSQLSGRGVGLDVVRAQLQALRGTVNVASVAGQGTTFTLTLPLTLSITQLIVCLVGSLPIALPAAHIEDILVPQSEQFRESGTQRLLKWREQTIPIYPFADLLQYTCLIPESITSQILATFPAPKDWSAPIVILRHENQVFGLAVNRIITEQELVIKPLSSVIPCPSYLYGCTILGDGSPIPVVDAAALLSRSLNPSHPQTTASQNLESLTPSQNSPVFRTTQTSTVLVVDDAIMMRRTLALFLEREGFRVLQAQDGQEAIDRLQNTSVQLVICDIEMPNMNGFEFLNARRQNPQIAEIPVIILTSRSNEKHRWLALKLGATAYFTKPYLEQEFLSALKTLLNPKVDQHPS